MLSRDITVTALIVTYNHRNYIAQAIESALAQQCDFAVEVLISEDASTDGTREIVQSFAEKWPDQVRTIFSETNVRSNEVVARGLKASRGRYVALLDGDDFWPYPTKLAAQVSFMEDHPTFSA